MFRGFTDWLLGCAAALPGPQSGVAGGVGWKFLLEIA